MPGLRLVRAELESREHLEHHKESGGVCRLPAVGHPTSVRTVRVDENHGLPGDAQVRGARGVVRGDVREVGVDLGGRRIGRTLLLVVERPAERAGDRQQRRDAAIRRAGLTPPTGDPGLDSCPLHRRDVLGGDRAGSVVPEGRREPTERVVALLVPGLAEPGVVEGGSDREGEGGSGRGSGRSRRRARGRRREPGRGRPGGRGRRRRGRIESDQELSLRHVGCPGCAVLGVHPRLNGVPPERSGCGHSKAGREGTLTIRLELRQPGGRPIERQLARLTRREAGAGDDDVAALECPARAHRDLGATRSHRYGREQHKRYEDRRGHGHDMRGRHRSGTYGARTGNRPV